MSDNNHHNKKMEHLDELCRLADQAYSILLLIDATDALEVARSDTISSCIDVIADKLLKAEELLIEHAGKVCGAMEHLDTIVNTTSQARATLCVLTDSDALQTVGVEIVSNCVWGVTSKLRAVKEILDELSLGELKAAKEGAQ